MTDGMLRLELGAPNLPHTHERLGYLLAARGNTDRAVYHPACFAELWSDAAPELRPRVEAARQTIVMLRRGTSW